MTTNLTVPSTFEHRTELVEKILRNMTAQHQNVTTTGILLAGDPGVGKTSFMHYFAELIGVELIVIEAPHISEEHIINIPFITVNPVTGEEKSSSVGIDDTDYKIVLSKSNLLSQIQSSKKVSDAQYLKKIYKSTTDIINVFENLGGDEKTIPEDIKKVRDKTNCILFLDEYFRQTSTRIRNMLRGILNKKLGLDDLPDNVYVIFASNMSDTGGAVENVPSNQQFRKVEFGTPNKDDWFSYLLAKFEKDEHVKLNRHIIDRFYRVLSEQDLNFHDLDANVRTSPRRWEQLLLYINAAFPIENEKDALSLITNIKLNFKDYLTGEHSSLAKKVVETVVELIDEISNIKVDANDVHGIENWRETLEHQIKMKMKLGKHRKYIPIMSGLPGIGKTAEAYKIAKDLGLGLIYIDCSTLEPEDVIGIPLSKSKGKNIETVFSEPKLYKIITEEARKYASKKGDHKYLIMFDELNRTSTKVFNAIRRVLLEGKFSDGLTLPAGSVVISAINPKDTGTSELTDHVKDVVDVIDSGATWAGVQNYINDMAFENVDDKFESCVKEVIGIFNRKFKIKKSEEHPVSQLNFFLNVAGNDVYMSPREYTDMYADAVLSLNSTAKKIQKNQDLYENNPDEMNHMLRKALYNSFEETISMVLEKQDAKSPQFTKELKVWFMSSDDLAPVDELITFKKNKTSNFTEIAQHYFNHPEEKLAKDPEFVNYLMSVDAAVFKEDFVQFLSKEMEHEKDAIEHILTKNITRKTKDAAGKEVKKELSRFENFIHEVAEASERHKMSYDKIEMIKDVTIEFLSKKIGDDNIIEMMEISRGLNKMVKDLVTNSNKG